MTSEVKKQVMRKRTSVALVCVDIQFVWSLLVCVDIQFVWSLLVCVDIKVVWFGM